MYCSTLARTSFKSIPWDEKDHLLTHADALNFKRNPFFILLC